MREGTAARSNKKEKGRELKEEKRKSTRRETRRWKMQKIKGVFMLISMSMRGGVKMTKRGSETTNEGTKKKVLQMGKETLFSRIFSD